MTSKSEKIDKSEKEKAFDILAPFIGKTICDTNIALFRQQSIFYDDLTQNNERTLCLAHYLNGVWKGFLLKNNKYVVDTFEGFHKHLPNESPVCMMHKILHICKQLFSDPPTIDLSFPLELRLPSNQVYVDSLKNTLNGIYTKKAKDILISMDSQNPNHQCFGPSYDSLSQTEDASKDFFEIGIQLLKK